MFIDHQQEQWPEWLGTAEFAYNNKVHTGTKVLPFQANNGQNPRMGFEMRKKGRFEKAEKFLKRMKEVQGEAKAALAKAQKDMKRYADNVMETLDSTELLMEDQAWLDYLWDFETKEINLDLSSDTD